MGNFFLGGTGNFLAIRLPNQLPPVMFFPNGVCSFIAFNCWEIIRADGRTGDLMSSWWSWSVTVISRQMGTLPKWHLYTGSVEGNEFINLTDLHNVIIAAWSITDSLTLLLSLSLSTRRTSNSWLSTGWFTMTIALELCDRINVYGMVPPDFCK